jgi:hypothetical protein
MIYLLSIFLPIIALLLSTWLITWLVRRPARQRLNYWQAWKIAESHNKPQDAIGCHGEGADES